MSKSLIVLSIFFLTGFNSCTDSSTNSCTDCPTKPDTTSHNFIWNLDTLGAEGSVVNDVAVISENDIWVVGYFFKTPYGGQDTIGYNAMHWNGVKWELKSIPIKNYFFPDQVFYTELKTIKIFSVTDIKFVSGASMTSFNGTVFNPLALKPDEAQGGITRIWGESSNKLYFGGTNGSLTYWNGSKFMKLETP